MVVQKNELMGLVHYLKMKCTVTSLYHDIATDRINISQPIDDLLLFRNLPIQY